jgi:hypothetical protein
LDGEPFHGEPFGGEPFGGEPLDGVEAAKGGAEAT